MMELFPESLPARSPKPAAPKGPRPWPHLLSPSAVPGLRFTHYALLLSLTNGGSNQVEEGRRRLAREVQALHPEWLNLTVGEGLSNKGVHYAFTTKEGSQAARAWFRGKGYSIMPKRKQWPALLRNYNKFVQAETETEPVATVRDFQRLCATDYYVWYYFAATKPRPTC